MAAPPPDGVPPHLAAAIKDAQSSSPASSRDRSFQYSWTDPSGHVWSGNFASRVPSIGAQIDIAKAVARRSANGSDSPVTGDVADLIYTIAYLDAALVQRPDWAKDLESLPYVEIVNGLAEEATAHLQAFRKR